LTGHFLLIIHQAHRIRKIQSVAIFQKVVITDLFCAHVVQNLKNSQEHEIKKKMVFATFNLSVATCGEWRQGWTTLKFRPFSEIVVS